MSMDQSQKLRAGVDGLLTPDEGLTARLPVSKQIELRDMFDLLRSVLIATPELKTRAIDDFNRYIVDLFATEDSRLNAAAEAQSVRNDIGQRTQIREIVIALVDFFDPAREGPSNLLLSDIEEAEEFLKHARRYFDLAQKTGPGGKPVDVPDNRARLCAHGDINCAKCNRIEPNKPE